MQNFDLYELRNMIGYFATVIYHTVTAEDSHQGQRKRHLLIKEKTKQVWKSHLKKQ